MSKHTSGVRWHLLCKCDDNCAWSRHVTLGRDADVEAELLVILRSHADSFLHGPRITGIAIGVNGDVRLLVLRHP